MSNSVPGLITAEATPLTAEAERLRNLFRIAAERELATMAASARTIVRAWAEAELAIEEARRSQEPGAANLSSAEAFRTRPYLSREEVSRERVERWCLNGNKPLNDEMEARVVFQNNAWVAKPTADDPSHTFVSTRAAFERITYLEDQGQINAPLLAESLCVPSIVAGGNAGWEPVMHMGPAAVLELLNKLEAGHTAHPTQRERTVEHVLMHRISPPSPALSGEI